MCKVTVHVMCRTAEIRHACKCAVIKHMRNIWHNSNGSCFTLYLYMNQHVTTFTSTMTTCRLKNGYLVHEDEPDVPSHNL